MAVKKKKNMTVFSTQQRTEQTAQPQSHGHITSQLPCRINFNATEQKEEEEEEQQQKVIN